ncbi:MAG: GTPase HflX [Alphaproteobacteria bacterium]|nr:GTPase HflX [Alphaproteobacteria bacterium]
MTVTEAFTDIGGIRHHDRAIVINPVIKGDRTRRDEDRALEEAVSLAEAIELNVVHAANVGLGQTVPATLLGRGQVENFAKTIEEKEAVLAVVNFTLTPVQQRNLETALKCKVIDRTGLILEIFGARARTREGQLQVELAALNYQKSRLVKSWSHLERQRGGFGFLGGPGESQLELDRRLITDRIVRLQEELDKVRRTRGLQREARHRAEHPTIALVGYTNAGKSTLFNRMTGADVLAKNMLFATLDPTMRGMKLPGGREVILSDTVGFISDLPTHLIESFRATLEEVQQADIIVHVRDISHPETREQRDAVMDILADLGIGADDDRLIEVQNKIDVLPEEKRKFLADYASRLSNEAGHVIPIDGLRQEAHGGLVGVSALTGEGIPQLLGLFERMLSARNKPYEITVAISDGAALSWLHAHGKIVERRDTKTKAIMKVELDAADYGRFESRFGKKPHAKD